MLDIAKQVGARPNKAQKSYEDLKAETLADPDVKAFISQQELSAEEITRSVSKFFEYIKERDNFLSGSESYIMKGYRPVLIKNKGYADVSYQETRELLDAVAQKSINQRIKLVNLPKGLRQISAKDMDFSDPNRMQTYAYLADFVEHFKERYQPGLYLYGSFGVGKTFIMAYLARELSEKCQVATTLLHFPSFAVDVKNAISSNNVKGMIDEIKSAPVLVLDDIGAEQFSAWLRDDVLQVILQHRMQEELPTFFTSNFSFEDLERHFANGRSGDETWQAKRLMERIKFLAKPLHLKGANRR
ncbi:primosomal protein DnaI [Streptococcus moroccensis]|uniref:Primosomal protein DnaI n=1 Tax=Streptococcus moroccensis TaxID=1451356 RepID=A0ABT9YQE7_9STRE|nr:primosomal protein DnaI [Streptococcus moroccensis]MDQ0222221.1 primosomal protein DnaI [Streptococcus moroccensis]